MSEPSKKVITFICESALRPHYGYDDLDEDGWEGAGIDAEDSVENYGVVWKPHPEYPDDILILYHVGDSNGFDYTISSSGEDVEKEYGHLDLRRVAEAEGVPYGEWLRRPVGRKVSDIIQVYGAEETFGSLTASGWITIGLSRDQRNLADELKGQLEEDAPVSLLPDLEEPSVQLPRTADELKAMIEHTPPRALRAIAMAGDADLLTSGGDAAEAVFQEIAGGNVFLYSLLVRANS